MTARGVYLSTLTFVMDFLFFVTKRAIPNRNNAVTAAHRGRILSVE